MDVRRDDLKRRKRRRQWLTATGFAALALAAGIGVARIQPAAPSVDRNSVWIDTVKRGEMLREVRGQGVLVPKEIRWIAASTQGTVQQIRVKPGAAVAADTVLMDLAEPSVIEQLDSAGAAVAAARADASTKRMQAENQLLDQKATLAQIQSTYELAKVKVEANAPLVERGIIAGLQFREYELAAAQQRAMLDIARQRVVKLEQTVAAQTAAEQARVDQAENTLALRRRQADALQVRAGIAGVLQSVPVQEGQQIAAGANLARVARPETLRAELQVAETQAKDVQIGQKVKVDTRNGVVDGTVERIDPAVLKGSVQVDVDLAGPLPPGARPDLSVDGTIEIERLSDIVYVGRPAAAQADSQLRLFRVEADGSTAERVPVRLGRASISLVEIVNGLQPGDHVVLSDTSAWDAYDRIRIR